MAIGAGAILSACALISRLVTAQDVEGTLTLAAVDYLDGTATEVPYLRTDDGGLLELDPLAVESLRVAAAMPGVRIRLRDASDPASLEVVGPAQVQGEAPPQGDGAAARGGGALSPTPVTGTRSVAVMLVNFQDDTRQPYSVNSARQMMFTTVKNWYVDASYDQLTLEGEVFGWLTLAIDKTCEVGRITAAVQAAAAENSIDLTPYQHVYVVFPRQGCGWAGLAFQPGVYAFTDQYFDKRVTVHELGHNLGLGHANGLRCGTQVIATPVDTSCQNKEYEDYYDAMGNGFGGVYHFNALYKAQLGWVAAEEVLRVDRDGVYELQPFESGASSTKAFFVESFFEGKPVEYHLEYRQKIGEDARISNERALNGVILRLSSRTALAGSWGRTLLLDTKPTSGTFEDAALPVGESYTEPGGVTFTPLEHDGSRMLVRLEFDPRFAAGMVELGSAWLGAGEGAESIVVSVERKVRSLGAVSVRVSTSDGTAKAGLDYGAVAETVLFEDGDYGPKTVTIPILQDGEEESVETFIVALTDPTGGLQLGAVASAQVNVYDDDQPSRMPYFEPTTYEVSEAASSVTLWVSAPAQEKPLSGFARYRTRDATAAAGTDYTAAQGALQIPPEVKRVPIEIEILNDSMEEDTETFEVELEGEPGTGGDTTRGSVAVITIIDDDGNPGTLEFTADAASAGEANRAVILSVARTDGHTGPVSVEYATADGDAQQGSDYTASEGVVSFAEGEAGEKTIAIVILDDAVKESRESFRVELQNVQGGAILGARDRVTVTIEDDDAPQNRPPSADDQTVVTDRDRSIAVVVTALDPDGDPIGYRLVDGPRHGQLSGELPQATYTPNPGFSGRDAFRFTADDGLQESEPATVWIRVCARVESAGGTVLRGLCALDGAGGVSEDATAVAGWRVVAGDREEAVLWTEGHGVEALGTGLPDGLSIRGTCISADGAVVAGTVRSASGSEAFRWTADGGIERLGTLHGTTEASAISADGAAVAGTSRSETIAEAFRWTSKGGLEGLGDLPGGDVLSLAMAVSSDGSVVVGASSSASGLEAFRWSAERGLEGLGDLDGGESRSEALSVSADGSVVLGVSSSARGLQIFRWTREAGMRPLGVVSEGTTELRVDRLFWFSGGFLVATAGDQEADLGRSFLWTEAGGLRPIEDVLSGDYGLDVGEWNLGMVVGLSRDGRRIVGTGEDLSGASQAWLVDLGDCEDVPEEAVISGVPVGLIDVGSTVALDGSGSSTGGADVGWGLAYRWEIVEGPGMIVGSDREPMARVTAQMAGAVQVMLTVDDGRCEDPGSTWVRLQYAVIEPLGLRCDSSGDGRLDVSDAVYSLNFLFLGGDPPPCPESADCDGDGPLNISDAIFGLNFLFLGGTPPPAPFPECQVFSGCPWTCREAK